MPFNFAQEHYLDLKKLITGPRRANVVPFVGAGLSLYGPPQFRLPRWGELVERICARAENQSVVEAAQIADIRSLLDAGQMIEALGKLYTFAGPQWVAQTVESILDIKADGVSPAAVALMAISWTMVVTTNLDRMLELAYAKLKDEGRISERELQVLTSRDEAEFLQSMSVEHAARTILAKIHGTVEDYQSFVLTSQDYHRLMNNCVYRYLMQDLFRRTLLIVGFSLNDPDFDWATDHIASNFRDKNYPPYAVLPDDTFELPPRHPYLRRIRQLQRQNDLRVITYRVDKAVPADDNWSGHRELFECLSGLHQTWLAAYQEFREHGATLTRSEHFFGRRQALVKLDQLVLEDKAPCQIKGIGGEGKTTLLSYWLESRRDRLRQIGIKDAFLFNCYSHLPAQFFAQASQNLVGVPAGLGPAEQKNAILGFVETRPCLFVFDGFEVFQDPNKGGVVRDLLLRDFLEDLVAAGARVILTTRVEVPNFGNVFGLGPLKQEGLEELRSTAEALGLHPARIERAIKHGRGHAQSLSLVLFGGEDASSTDEQAFVPDPDLVTTLTYNKALPALKTVRQSLSLDEDTVLQVASIFDRPFTLDTLRHLFAMNIDDVELRLDIDNNELEPLINDLVDQQLIISNDGPATYSLHPNVRDFYRLAVGINRKLHRAYVDLLLDRGPPPRVQTFADAEPYFAIATHAAHAEDWPLFDNYYINVLMRGQEDYVCDTLGLWSEILDLTRHVFPDFTPQIRSQLSLPYYASRYARSLKHLGHGHEAVLAYDACLKYCADEAFTKTTIYINNYLTLLIYMGDLKKARRMSAWNFASLQWIKDEDGVSNQIEHGGYSLGWLAMLSGDFETAAGLYDLAERAWEGREDNKTSFFQYYPIYFSEMYLMEDGDTARAESVIGIQLSEAQDHGWMETEARCHVFASLLHRHRARTLRDMVPMLQVAQTYCFQAEAALKKIFAPPVEVELILEQLCLYFEAPSNPNFPWNAARLLERFESRVFCLSLNLFQPDLIAFKGLYAHVLGKLDDAKTMLSAAETAAREQNNAFSELSPYRPLSMLRARLGSVSALSVDTYAGQFSDMMRLDYSPMQGNQLKDAVDDGFITQPSLPI